MRTESDMQPFLAANLDDHPGAETVTRRSGHSDISNITVATSDNRCGMAIVFERDDIQPPVYVAGTFTDPDWEIQEMQVEQKEDGQYKADHIMDEQAIGYASEGMTETASDLLP